MKIYTKGRVAIAAILDVAIHGTSVPVRLGDTSERLHVSISYLEQIFQKLIRMGFIASYRGPGGGYRMKRPLSAISAADVIDAVDGEPLDLQPRIGLKPGTSSVGHITTALWCRMNKELHDYLRSVTLESLFAEARQSASPRETSDFLAEMAGTMGIPRRPGGAGRHAPFGLDKSATAQTGPKVPRTLGAY